MSKLTKHYLLKLFESIWQISELEVQRLRLEEKYFSQLERFINKKEQDEHDMVV